jgi:sarcosine oxidase
MSEGFDVIVVGLGAMGAATTYQLAQRGCHVLGIDQFAPPHVFGSSHGDTRITRLACGEGEEYTALARRSNEIWRDLERRSGQSLLVQEGFLAISGPGERAKAHENADFLNATIAIARRQGVDHELLNGTRVRARFPAFAVSDSDRAYFEPSGGILFPERCIEVQLAEAGRLGARLNTGETVQRIAPSGTHVEIVTDRTTYTAGRLVIAAGPWLAKFLSSHLAALFTVRRQVLYWFRLVASNGASLDRFRPDAFPVFYWQVPRHQSIYGFPWIGSGEPTVKIATEQYDTQTSPEAVDREVPAEEICAMHETYIAPFFPGLSADCARTATCLYTCVKDARFVVDALPGAPRVMIVSPCSGHGFKHSAAIGEAVAGWAMGGPSENSPLAAFSFAAAK